MWNIQKSFSMEQGLKYLISSFYISNIDTHSFFWVFASTLVLVGVYSKFSANFKLWSLKIFWWTNQKLLLLKFVQVNLCQKLFFLQNMGRTCCVQKFFWMSETISVHNMFSPGLSLEFSCIELVIQWTICRHILG